MALDILSARMTFPPCFSLDEIHCLGPFTGVFINRLSVTNKQSDKQSPGGRVEAVRVIDHQFRVLHLRFSMHAFNPFHPSSDA